MNDRELLDKAAKAAGLNITWENSQEYAEVLTPFRGHLMNYEPWNPLTDDGDALRLAAKTGQMNLLHLLSMYGDADLYKIDPCAATRRAITRAAAAMAND